MSRGGHGDTMRNVKLTYLILTAMLLTLAATPGWTQTNVSTGQIFGTCADPDGAATPGVVIQIMILDIVFSLDSVITSIGMVNEIAIMVTAVVIAVGIMLFASGPISAFVNDRPTLKILALSFLLLIGISLVADGLGFHIPKGYIYFAMGFSVFVEIINLQVRARTKPVQLRQRYIKE